MGHLLSDITSHNGRKFYCERCLHRFSRDDLLNQHIRHCDDHNPQHLKMPSEDNSKLLFNQQKYMQPVPFVIFEDFESLVCKITSASGNQLKN